MPRRAICEIFFNYMTFCKVSILLWTLSILFLQGYNYGHPEKSSNPPLFLKFLRCFLGTFFGGHKDLYIKQLNKIRIFSLFFTPISSFSSLFTLIFFTFFSFYLSTILPCIWFFVKKSSPSPSNGQNIYPCFLVKYLFFNRMIKSLKNVASSFDHILN